MSDQRSRAGLERRAVLLGGLAASASGCGYVLYPGRVGRRGGSIDVPVLIIDLLWLLPGLLPGAICLVVDFTTGCIYRGGGRAQTSSPPSPVQSVVTQVVVELDGQPVAAAPVLADRRASLEWSEVIDEAALRARGKLVVRTSDGAVAEAHARTFA